MCDWFSAITKGDGKLIYFNEEHRRLIREKNLFFPDGSLVDEADSHSFIANFFGLDCDKVNKYEFRPLDRYHKIGQINVRDDRREARGKIERLDFRKLTPPELILRPIYDPFKKARKRITQKDMVLLEQWASVWKLRKSPGRSPGWSLSKESVWCLIEDLVEYSVSRSVWESVWCLVGHSICRLIRCSVYYSTWNSPWSSVPPWDSLWDSACRATRAYASSFFTLPQGKHPEHKPGKYLFQPAIDLWHRNLVPSFDGRIWRLHTGPDAHVVEEVSLKV